MTLIIALLISIPVLFSIWRRCMPSPPPEKTNNSEELNPSVSYGPLPQQASEPGPDKFLDPVEDEEPLTVQSQPILTASNLS